MNIAKETKTELNILCIGQPISGKSFFLRKITRQKEQNHHRHTFYKMYLARIKGIPVYFHELSQKIQLYLEEKYDGVLYFIDLVGTRRSVKNMLRWMDEYSKCSTQQVYNIPIQIIIARAYGHRKLTAWRKKLEKELETVVNPNQITFWETLEQGAKVIRDFCLAINDNKGQCLQRSFQTQWKMLGFWDTFLYFIQKFQYYFIFGNNTSLILIDDNESNSEDDSQSSQSSQDFDMALFDELNNDDASEKEQIIERDKQEVIKFNNSAKEIQGEQKQTNSFEKEERGNDSS